jgi:hypothetical protein
MLKATEGDPSISLNLVGFLTEASRYLVALRDDEYLQSA